MLMVSAIYAAWCGTGVATDTDMVPLAQAILALISLVLLGLSSANAEGDGQVYPGYVDDVALERNLKYQELIIPPMKVEDDKPPIKDLIFDATVTKDIERRYEDKFGRTPIEQNFNRMNQYADVTFDNGETVSVQREAELELAFGEFMTRKLIEYHLDQFLQQNETLRPAYRIKEQLRQANVSVNGGWRFRFRYSLSGEELKMEIENPFDIETRVFIREDDTILRMGYWLQKDLRFSTFYYEATARLQFVFYRKLKEGFGLTLTESFFTNRDVYNSRDNRIILGFIWSN